MDKKKRKNVKKHAFFSCFINVQRDVYNLSIFVQRFISKYLKNVFFLVLDIDGMDTFFYKKSAEKKNSFKRGYPPQGRLRVFFRGTYTHYNYKKVSRSYLQYERKKQEKTIKICKNDVFYSL